MQGQRGTIGSLPETLSFDHGSISTSAVDQQIFWNNIQNPPEITPPYIPSPAGTTMTYVNSLSHDQHSSNAWSLDEPSSHGPQNNVTHDERRTQLRWSPLTLCTEAGLRIEEQQCEPASNMPGDGANVNPMFLQSSNSNVMSQNLNLNASFVSHDGDNFQVSGCPNIYKSGASENEQIPPLCGSESFVLPSGSGEYVDEGNNGRPGSSFEGGRRACKRKALEGNVDNSSVSGSSGYFHHAESSAQLAVSASNDGGSSLSIYAPSGQVSSGHGLGLRGLAPDGVPGSPMAGNAESSRRNFRVRINPPIQPKHVPYALFPTGAAVWHSNISSAQQSSRLRLNERSLDSRTAPVVDNANPQSQPFLLHVPMFPQNLQPFQWDKGSSSRTGSSSSSNVVRDRDAFPREETRRRMMGRSMLENPMFIAAPDLRNLVRNPENRSLAGGNISIQGNVASSSRAGSSSGVHQPSTPTWIPHPNPSQYPHRFSELIHRSLISSAGSESAGQSSNQLPLRSGPLSPEDMVLSSRAGNQRHNQSYPRSASHLLRQDGGLGFPHPLRALAAAGEGRNRLVVSEIRNVLDLMRRGEGLQFEDVMILDQSVFFGVADIHDRHRDMRLDVDNMSYEELLALEERIGNVSTGLSEETIKTQLKQQKYFILIESQQEQEPCCICQEEYNNGEDIGRLDCGHDFHTNCIKQWLMNKNLCPICKTTAMCTS